MIIVLNITFVIQECILGFQSMILWENFKMAYISVRMKIGYKINFSKEF